MSWFAELAGKAESLLNNIDEQTGAALRNHNVSKTKKFEINGSEFVQKKRPLPLITKRTGSANDTRNNSNVRKSPPTTKRPSNSQIKEGPNLGKKPSPIALRKSPVQKSSSRLCSPEPYLRLVDNDILDSPAFRERRRSLPIDLDLINNESLIYNMQNLEVENAMLKNEVNLMNREISELLERLRKTEDELNNTKTYLKEFEQEKDELLLEKRLLTTQIQQFKQKIYDVTNNDIVEYKEQILRLEEDAKILTDRYKGLEEVVEQLNEKENDTKVAKNKIETELKHANTTINELQGKLEKVTNECRRLEKDWETYKLRVKSMLNAKDNEIKAIQNGTHLDEDIKTLKEELEVFREERENLTDVVNRLQGECEKLRHNVEQLEAKNNTSERIVNALREALKEERVARNKVEGQYIVMAKELKCTQMESSQIIARLKMAVQERDCEIENMRKLSSATSTDTSALNVADYDAMKENIETEKLHHLTNMLVQKQAKIDKLLADNNILKIQMDKLQSKHNAEIATMRNTNAHSVVHLHEGDSRSKTRSKSTSALSVLSLRMGVLLKRYPIFRVLIVGYMVCLHFWVLTVLFTSTPEDSLKRPTNV